MKWWGLMQGSFTPATGFVVDEADILSRERFNLGDNIISDSELRFIGEAQNSDDLLMVRGTSCLRNEIPFFWNDLHDLMYGQKTVMWSVGVGATLPVEMPDSFYRALPRVSWWGVRGPASKMLLMSHGVPEDRICVTHCPTLLRGIMQGFQHKMKEPTDIKTVLFGNWDGPLPPGMNRLAEEFARNGCRVIIHFQDHREVWQAIHDTAPPWSYVPERLRPLFMKYEVAMSRQPAELDALLQEVDLCISLKLHVSLPALAWGIPTYTVTDDWRLKEILQPQGLPLLHPHEVQRWNSSTLYRKEDFEGVPEVVSRCYGKNMGFLNRAGVNFDFAGS